MSPAPSRSERGTAALLGLFYAAAGVLHLAAPDAFLPIMPASVPWPREVVLATGVAELAGALGLQSPRLRRAAGLGLAAYALAVWPANFKHAFDAVVIPGLPTSWWYHGPRLAFQPVLIGAALYAGGWLSGRPSAPAP